MNVNESFYVALVSQLESSLTFLKHTGAPMKEIAETTAMLNRARVSLQGYRIGNI